MYSAKELKNKPFTHTYDEMMNEINTIAPRRRDNSVTDGVVVFSCPNTENSDNKETTIDAYSACYINSGSINKYGNRYRVFTEESLTKKELLNIYFLLQHINIDEKSFYSMYTIPNTQKLLQYPNESTKTLKHWRDAYLDDTRNWWRVRNTYIYLNEGKRYIREFEINIRCENGSYYKKIVIRKFESRNTEDVMSFNTYYVDIDLNTKNHPLTAEEVEREQIKVADALIALISPTSITFTRNGIQATFSIHNKEQRLMTYHKWKNNEKIICEFIRANISPYVDVCSCDAVHLYRMPFSFHRKKKNGDVDDYEVSLYYLSDHLFTTDEIINKYTVKGARKKQKEFSDGLKKEVIISSNDVIDAICNKDVKFFAKYIDKCYTKMSTKERREYLRSYDMLYFLQIGKGLKKSFSSIFREDRHPSAFVDYLTNERSGESFYAYTDRAIEVERKNGDSGVFCADLIHFCSLIGEMTEREAFVFLCQIFFPTVGTVVDVYGEENESEKTLFDYVNDNVRLFDEYTKLSQYKRIFNDKSKKLYNTLNKMFVQYIKRFKIEDYQNLCVMAAQEYLAKETGLSCSYIKRMLSVFDYIGLLHKQPNTRQLNERGRIPTVYVGLTDITSVSFTSLVLRRMEAFNHYFPQMNSVTQIELDKVRIDY